MKAPIKALWIVFVLAVIAAYAIHHRTGKIQDRMEMSR
jgi:hypothetical protein